MIEIKWKGKIGYGDVVSPICYAHNVSFKLQTPVKLVFFWPHGPKQRVHDHDPETLWERADYIASLCCKIGTDVSVTHMFNSNLNTQHTNYKWDVVGHDRFHNFWFPVTPNCLQEPSNIIVVNSTKGNFVSLADYGKSWKDPAAGKWDQIVGQLSAHGSVVTVDNRTPISQLLSLLRKSKAFVGYHGTAAWPAKFMQVPSIIISGGGSLTRSAFPSAYITNNITPLDSFGNIHTHASGLLKQSLIDYATYKPSQQFIDHLVHTV